MPDWPAKPAVLEDIPAPPPALEPLAVDAARQLEFRPAVEVDGQEEEGQIGRLRAMLGLNGPQQEEDWELLRLDDPGSPEPLDGQTLLD